MATKSDTNAIPTKESLFEDYFQCALASFEQIESLFCLDGLVKQFMGVDVNNFGGEKFTTPEDAKSARSHVQRSDAWSTLSALYDYAVDGIHPATEQREDIVIGGQEILSCISTQEYEPAEAWFKIVSLGDGRYALDEGMDMMLDKLALLADVDVRTVRNAISANELEARKVEGAIFIDNQSARRWLNGRRNFKPTRMINENLPELNAITSPAQFGAFLKTRRQTLGLDLENKKLIFFHPAVNPTAISDIENGVFRLPIDTVFPLADFYQLNRNEFLTVIMQIFFHDQFVSIKESIKK